ncbi:unnamed protein product [Miscanthus lutarioriparius]|uniref:F-box domain-containing protein n=1 Tax=Miscanthus lutarioriparius TaxID=422564 RepID=A0A811NLS2_9POAL|nr:unnamed protein product [Miscanthus lutarioriparius]
MDGGGDLISVLPDGVLGEIVTRLPTADAVRVQVLSTRWRHIWRSSPLNLDLRSPNYYDDYKRLVSGILAAHLGPGRRLKVDWPYDDGESYNRWLQSPALIGLQELGIEAGYTAGLEDTRAPLPRRGNTRALPERALFQFAPTLRLLKIGYHTFPSADSSTTNDYDSYFFDYDFYDFDYENMRVRVTTWQVIIEDAPLLEKLIPCRRSASAESFQLLVHSAPRLRVLGSLSSSIPKLEIGGTVFATTIRRVNRVRPDNVIMEKRLLMQADMLATTLRTVKILALEDADSIDVVSNYLKCFPCLEKLYISASQGYRSAASYDKQNPIECLEHHLKMVALDVYDGIRPHVKFAQFFVRNARLLELMKFRIFRNYDCEPGRTKEWIEDQQRQLQVRSMASRHVKFHFVHDARYYQDVYCGEDISDLSEHIHDSSRDDPFDQWFESEKEALAC